MTVFFLISFLGELFAVPLSLFKGSCSTTHT